MTIPEEGEIIMQFVKTADLKPGMRLAKPIYNRMGVLLYLSLIHISEPTRP